MTFLSKREATFVIGLLMIFLLGCFLKLIKRTCWTAPEEINQVQQEKINQAFKQKIGMGDTLNDDAKKQSRNPSINRGYALLGYGSKKKFITKINVNSATQEQLEALKGIGPSTSKKIIAYRKSNGPFLSIQQIKNVKGIGEKTFEKIKDHICVR